MPAKRLVSSEVPHILEIERLRFSDVKDDLLEPQEHQVNSCLQLWLTPDTSSRQWGRRRARQFLEAVYNDKSLGKDVFLLCALGIRVTILGRINLIEAVSLMRKWWRKVDHPRGLTETAEEYVKGRQDVFSKIKSDSNSPSAPAVEPEDSDLSVGSHFPHTVLGSQASSGNPTWPGAGQYFCLSFTGRDMIENLPESIRTGLKNSNMWKNEQEKGVWSVTNCLSLYLPEEHNQDTLLVIRMGYHDGFNLSDSLGLWEDLKMMENK